MADTPMAASSNGGADVSASAPDDRPVNERLLFCAEVLIGYKCTVELVDGTIYEGIFHTMKVDGKHTHAVLKYAKVAKDPNVTADDLQAIAKKPELVKIFHSDDIAAVVARDVRMAPEDLGSEQYELGFETDAAISRGRGGLVNRELVAWMPDPNDDTDATMFGLEESHEAGWDQFAVNERKFGYQSGWSEDYYTVKLDKSKCGIDEETAARLAREIERGDTSNPHLAEERGQEVDDSGLDEEDKYSGVIRPEDLMRLRANAHHHIPQQQQNGAPAQQQKPAAWSKAGSGLTALTGQQQRPATAPQQPPGIGPMSMGSTCSSSSMSAAASSAHQITGTAAGAAAPAAPPGLPATATASAPVCIPARPSAAGSSSSALVGSAPGGSPASAVSGSAPSEGIDPRREANKIRMSLTGSLNKNRSSPYGTPKGLKSPLLSPLVSDPLKVAALNLEPGVTKVDEDTRQQFLKFKTQLQAQRDAAAAQSALSSALASSKRTAQSPTVAAAVAAGDSAGAGTQAPAGVDPTVQQPQGRTAAAGSAAASAADSKQPNATAVAKAGDQPPPKPKSSKLNPNAKPFTLNINAKPFVPGGSSSSSATLAAAATKAASSTGDGAAGAGSGHSTAQQSHAVPAYTSALAQPQQMTPAVMGAGMPPPGLGVQPSHVSGGPAGSTGGTLMGMPAAQGAVAATAGGPPPGLGGANRPVPAQPPPPMAATVPGVPASGLPGQMVQAPPPPGAVHVTPMPAVVPPGAVPIPPGTIMQAIPPGAVHMMPGAGLPGTPLSMAAAAAAAATGASAGLGVGVPPAGMVMPQMTPGAVAAAAAAMGMAPPPPGMMAPPGVMPVAAVPRPPMAVAGPPPGMAKGPGAPHSGDRGSSDRAGPHPPPRAPKGHHGTVERDGIPLMQPMGTQGGPAAGAPVHPPSMRMGGPMAAVGPPAIPVPHMSDGTAAAAGMAGPPPGAPPPMPVPLAIAMGVPPPMHHGRPGDGQPAGPAPTMTVPAGMQPMPPVVQQHRVGVSPEGTPVGYPRGEGHRGQEGHRMHREPRSGRNFGHGPDRESEHTPPSSSSNTPSHMHRSMGPPAPGQAMQGYPSPHVADGQHGGMAGPGLMHGGPHVPPPYGSPNVAQQQHNHGSRGGSGDGPTGRVGSTSSSGPPAGMGAMPPHGHDSGPGSNSSIHAAGAGVAGYTPHHHHHPIGSSGGGGIAPPHSNMQQPAPPAIARGAEGTGSFTGPAGAGPGSTGPHTGAHAGPSSSHHGPGGGSAGLGAPLPPFSGPPLQGGMPPPSMGMSSGPMGPHGMPAAMMAMPMIPPGAVMGQYAGQPVMMQYPAGAQAPAGMFINAGGPTFMVPAGMPPGMQPPPYMYMAGPVPPGSSPHARPGFFPPGAYPVPMSPGGTMAHPMGMLPPGNQMGHQQQQQQQHGGGAHGGDAAGHGGPPGTPTAPSPHSGMSRGTPPHGSVARERRREMRAQRAGERMAAGDHEGKRASTGSAPATPPGVQGSNGGPMTPVAADGPADGKEQ